jgi:hypothetical protein
MNDQIPSAAARDDAAESFAGIAAEFGEIFGTPATLAEFLEILGWAIPLDSDATDGSFLLPLEYTVRLRGHKRYRSSTASRVGELGDHLFVEACDHTTALIERMHAENGAQVTPQQFALAVLAVLRTGRVTFADVNVDDIRELSANVPSKRIAKPRVGDVIAIPARRGGYHMAVVVARNRFGTALGLFNGISAHGRLTGDLCRSPRRFPVYTGDDQVKKGVWKVVEHDESLLALFPANPEIYHRPGTWESVGIYTGQFGAAESAGNDPLRMIDDAEAVAVGLTDGTYRSAYTAIFLQKCLDDQTNLPP